MYGDDPPILRLGSHWELDAVEVELRPMGPDGHRLPPVRRRITVADLWAVIGSPPSRAPMPTTSDPAPMGDPPPVTVADAAARWMREVVNVPGTYKPDEAYRKRMHWQAHLAPVFGAHPLRAVTPSVVSRWVGDMAQAVPTPAPSTLRNRFAVLLALLGWCTQMGWVPANPCAAVKLPRVRRGSDHIHVFTPEEAGRVVAHFRAKGDPWDTMVPVLLLTGLRRGELVALHVDDVDIPRKMLRVQRAISGVEVGVPKGGGPRSIPLSDLAAAPLKTQLVRVGRSSGPLWPSPVASRTYRGVDDVGSTIAQGLRDAGIQASAHDFRHTCATLLAAVGTPPHLIQRAMGHESIQTTMRYVHAVANDPQLADAMRRLAEELLPHL